MAESTHTIKRSREEESQEAEENFCEENNNTNTKRHKSYNDILSILEEEEYLFESDPVFGSNVFTTLQQELLPSDGFSSDPVGDPVSIGTCISQICSSAISSKEDEEDDKSNVIRHLLEASDDELGIPSGDGTKASDFPAVEDNVTDGGGFPFAISDDLWELEDEAANYYSLLQSELFM